MSSSDGQPDQKDPQTSVASGTTDKVKEFLDEIRTQPIDLRALGLITVSVQWRRKLRWFDLYPDTQLADPNDERITGVLRAAGAAALVKRDGNRCSIRSPFCTQGEHPFANPVGADFDHIDGNKFNHKLENLRLSCHPCNSHRQEFQRKQILAAATRAIREREKAPGALTETEKAEAPAVLRINIDNYPVFCKWLKDEVDVHKEITVKHAISGGAKYMRKQTGHGSPQSARNYLDMETDETEGEYEIVEGMVRRRDPRKAEAVVLESPS